MRSLNTSLRLGVIGAGRMGVTHHCIANSREDARVVAVADPSPVVTKMLSKYAGVSAHKDYKSMLAKEQLDAVLVCTPPTANGEILTAVAEKGLHAFVEKPFTLDPAEGRRLAQLFRERNLVGQVGYVNRFNDVFTRLRAYLEAGVVGKVIRFRSEMFSATIIRDPGEGGWRSTHANGGGATYEMASHAIDLINYLMGRPDRVSGASLSKVFSRNVEDVVSATFHYGSGVAGTLYVNWSDPSFRKPTNKIEVFGDKGKIQADQHGMKVFCAEARPEHGFSRGWNQLYITDLFNPVPFYLRGVEFTAQLYDFLDHVRRGDAQTRCTFEDGAAVLELIQDIFRDSQSAGGLN